MTEPSTPAERSARYRRNKGVKARAAPVHGEMSGVWWHKNRREAMCAACEPAYGQYLADDRAKQKAAYDPAARRARYEASKSDD